MLPDKELVNNSPTKSETCPVSARAKGLALRENIELVEKACLDLPQVSCPVIHRFSPGLYIREVTIPAGTFAIGHHQNFEHLNVFLRGRLLMLNEDGTTTEMIAPMTFVSKPGRKISFNIEETVWLNIYPTDETDIEKLEAKYLTKSTSWVETVKAKVGVETIKADLDRKDFKRMLEEMQLDEGEVRRISENTEDMTDLPFGNYKFKVGQSKIEGRGLISTADIKAGERIAPARIDGKRTIAGRFTNHSLEPNAQFIRGQDCEAELVAIRDIEGCRGGLDGEEITVNYREALKLAVELNRGNLCQL